MGVVSDALKQTGISFQPTTTSSDGGVSIVNQAFLDYNKKTNITPTVTPFDTPTQSAIQSQQQQSSFLGKLKLFYNNINEGIDNWIDQIKKTKVGQELGKVRKEVNRAVGNFDIRSVLVPLAFIFPKPVYGPDVGDRPENIDNLVKDYEKSLSGQVMETPNVFLKSGVKGYTGGIIKPEYKMPDTISAKVADVLGEVAGSIAAIRTIENKLTFLNADAGLGKMLLKYEKVGKVAQPLIKNATAFGIYGQLDPDLENRINKFVFDGLTATAFSALGFIRPAKISVPANFSLGFGLAKLSGASNEDAIINGAVLAGLDAFGRYKGWKTQKIDNEKAQKILKTEAINTFNELTGAKITEKTSIDEINRIYRQAAKKLHPDITGSQSEMTALNTAYEFITGKSKKYQKPTKPIVKQSEKQTIKETKLLKPPTEGKTAPAGEKAPIIKPPPETLQTTSKPITLYRGAKDHTIDVTRENGITGGVSLSENKAVAERFAKMNEGTVKEYRLKEKAKIINYSELEQKFSGLTGEERNNAIKEYLKEHKIDAVRFDVPKGSQSEAEIMVVNKDALEEVGEQPKKTKQSPTQMTEKDTKKLEQTTTKQPTTSIPKELEQLAKEAGSAEEFVKEQSITKMSNVDGADFGALKQLKEVAKRQLERIKQLKTQIKDSPINQQNSLKVQLLKAQSNYEYTKQSIVDLEKQITKRASELGQITKLNKTNNFSKSQLTDIRNKDNQQQPQIKPQETTPPLSPTKKTTGRGEVKKEPLEAKKQAKKLKAPSGNATVGEFGNIESEIKKLKNIKAMDFPEILRLTKELLGKTPEITDRFINTLGKFYSSHNNVDIKLARKIFQDPDLAQKVLAHEIGHLIDYLPDETLARGNLIGRLKVLKRYLSWSFGEELKDEVLRKELKDLSYQWRPFDESIATPEFIKYRNSSIELYADAISILFNDPDLLEQKAPNFWKGFFDNLDKKPQVKEALFGLWNLLNEGEARVMSEREKQIFEMFNKGEDQFRAKILEKKRAKNDWLFMFKKQNIDKNQALINRVNKLKKQGVNIPDEENPVYLLENYNYINSKLQAWVEKNIEPLYEDVQKEELTWEEFGEFLFLNRVANERGAIREPINYLKEIAPEVYEKYKDILDPHLNKGTQEQLKVINNLKTENKEAFSEISDVLPKGLANPLGFDVITAKKQLEFLRQRIGNEKYEKLKDFNARFQAINDAVLELARKKGYFSNDLVDKLRLNKSYATFQVIDYLDTYISPEIKEQKGTLKDIANPVDATIYKTLSLIRAVYRNEAKLNAINVAMSLKEVSDAKTRFVNNRKEFIPPKDDNLELVMVKENGEWKGYYVPEDLGDILNTKSTGELNLMVKGLQLLNNKAFRPLFITLSVGFQSINSVRDMMRYWIHRPDKTLGDVLLSFPKTLYYYGKALKPAIARGFGKKSDIITEMRDNFMLDVTYNDLITGAEEGDKRIELLLNKYREKDAKGILKVLEFIKNVGSTLESLPKVAAYLEFENKLPRQKLIKFIREAAGSPDFLRKGAGYTTYNNVFLFSNAMKEGMRTDLSMALGGAKEYGGSQSAYWFKRIIANIFPKLLMFAAIYGLFGEKVKRMYQKVSEYDKTNYQILVLGEDEDGKVLYLRVPQDEFGRLVGGLTWKTLQTVDPEKKEHQGILRSIMDIVSYGAGQFPNITPAITLPLAIAQYLAGQNPYDFFYGRNVIPEKEFKAGGEYSLIPFLKWLFRSSGGRIIMNFDIAEQSPTTETWYTKILKMPILSDIVGRWIKVSNYGDSERLRLIKQEIEQKKAIKSIEETKIINKYIKEYLSEPPSEERKLAISQELVNTLLNDQKLEPNKRREEVNRILKKFNIGIVKRQSDPYSNAIISATTNEEKMAIIDNFAKEKSKKELRDWIALLYKYQVISKDFLKEVEKKHLQEL
jgi:hypothetical protein